MSFCIKNGDKVQGLFLLHKEGKKLFRTEYLCDVSEDVRTHNLLLIKSAVEALLGKYPPDTQLLIPKGTIDWKNGAKK